MIRSSLRRLWISFLIFLSENLAICPAHGVLPNVVKPPDVDKMIELYNSLIPDPDIARLILKDAEGSNMSAYVHVGLYISMLS